MESHEIGAGWHHHRIPVQLVDVYKTTMGRKVNRHLAPQLRGRLTPRILDALEGDGWHVHQIGQAVYVHAPGGVHLIFGVWPRRSPAPPWADRLGMASAGYLRRVDRRTAEQAWRRMARDLAGRFSHRLPWYHWPAPAAYTFEGIRPGWADVEAAAAAERNARIRIARGLQADPDTWYGETSPTLSRLMDGDR